MKKPEDDGKVACPRCGQRMRKIKDKLPIHTKTIWLPSGDKAEICQ